MRAHRAAGAGKRLAAWRRWDGEKCRDLLKEVRAHLLQTDRPHSEARIKASSWIHGVLLLISGIRTFG